MPACAYRSTTARIRAQLPKPSPPLSAEGSFEKKVSEKPARAPGRGKFTGTWTTCLVLSISLVHCGNEHLDYYSLQAPVACRRLYLQPVPCPYVRAIAATADTTQ